MKKSLKISMVVLLTCLAVILIGCPKNSKEEKPAGPSTVWRTVKLGNGPKTLHDFRLAMKSSDIACSGFAKNMLLRSNFSATTQESDEDLVVVEGDQLGFDAIDKEDGISYDRFSAIAKEKGLELCTREAVLQLLLQHGGTIEGKKLIASDIIHLTDTFGAGSRSSGNDCLFIVAQNKLGCRFVESLDISGSQWIFVRPRPKPLPAEAPPAKN